MKSYNYLFSLILLFFSVSIANAENFNEAHLHKFIEEIDKTVMQQDITKLAGFLSDDITITTYVSILGNLRTHSSNKTNYLKTVEAAWEKAENYQYSRENIEIELLDNGKKARISSTIRESMIYDGIPITSIATEANIVELIDGKAQITKVTGETTI